MVKSKLPDEFITQSSQKQFNPIVEQSDEESQLNHHVESQTSHDTERGISQQASSKNLRNYTQGAPTVQTSLHP